ncbi:MAG: transposase, partial [Chlamydiales bacterium]|nr:transposase [Chlamydiales bacterium]
MLDLLACKDGRGRPALIRDYMFFCAILYVMRTGISWRDLPDF